MRAFLMDRTLLGKVSSEITQAAHRSGLDVVRMVASYQFGTFLAPSSTVLYGGGSGKRIYARIPTQADI